MPLRVGTLLPSFAGATGWLNASDDFAPSASWSPLLVHFWAVSCPACHSNMPALHELRDKYRPQGLHVIAVHRPRGEFDLDTDKLRYSIVELGITEPYARDNEHTVGDLFEVAAWPTYFLFDASGLLRRHAVGAHGVVLMETALERMYDSVVPVSA